MIDHIDIRAVLEARLAALDGFPTAWENVPYKPQAGVAYQKAFYLPGTDQPAGIFAEAGTYFSGLFQVSLSYPAGNGSGAAGQRAALVRAHFARGTRLISADQRCRVTCLQPYNGPSLGGTDWYVLPITIPWFCYSFPEG